MIIVLFSATVIYAGEYSPLPITPPKSPDSSSSPETYIDQHTNNLDLSKTLCLFIMQQNHTQLPLKKFLATLGATAHLPFGHKFKHFLQSNPNVPPLDPSTAFEEFSTKVAPHMTYYGQYQEHFLAEYKKENQQK